MVNKKKISTFFSHKFFTSFRLSLGPCELPHKCWAWSVQLGFDVNWIQTDKQTDEQTI